jgi:ankyrin repeat protein
VVRYLINQGANIHAQNNETLRWSAYYAHLEVVRYLINQGANIHANNNGALQWSSQNGYLEVVQQLFGRSMKGYGYVV